MRKANKENAKPTFTKPEVKRLTKVEVTLPPNITEADIIAAIQSVVGEDVPVMALPITYMWEGTPYRPQEWDAWNGDPSNPPQSARDYWVYGPRGGHPKTKFPKDDGTVNTPSHLGKSTRRSPRATQDEVTPSQAPTPQNAPKIRQRANQGSGKGIRRGTVEPIDTTAIDDQADAMLGDALAGLVLAPPTKGKGRKRR